MIKNKSYIFCLLLLCPGLVVAEYLQVFDSKITVLTEEWPPYNYSKDGVTIGFSVEIVEKLIQETNSNAVIKMYPSMRASHKLSTEPRKMFISMFRTKEREDKFNWIGPLVDSSIYFYKRKGSTLSIRTSDDAKRVGKIATRHSGLVYNILIEDGFSNLDSSAESGEPIYRKVLLGRSDLGISDSHLGVKYILKKMGYPTDSLIKTKVKVIDSQLFIAVSKDIPISEVSRWQAALNKLIKDGEYTEIYQKYNN